jgi:uncharacterized beta-barrel protein YwiB (DUF1934 family)
MKLTGNSEMYKITVVNKQTVDTETNVIEEQADGSYTEKNGKIYIRYKSSSEDSGESSTLITIDNGTVTIKRFGASGSVMVYKKDKKTEFQYRTPYGIIPMELKTSKLVTAFDKDGGTLRICYTISVQGDKYFNDITIKVTGR